MAADTPVTDWLSRVSVVDPFGTLDPFGSGTFSSAEGFADFSHMSKVRRHARLPACPPVCALPLRAARPDGSLCLCFPGASASERRLAEGDWQVQLGSQSTEVRGDA